MFVVRGTTALDDLILAVILIAIVLIIIYIPFLTTLNTQLKVYVGMQPNAPTPWWWYVIAFMLLFIAFYLALHGF